MWFPGRPRLSVITPLFNCLAETQAMVASLRATVPPWLSYEIILVDDGSTDGTRAWLAGLRRPYRVILNERNLGFGASSNRGAAAARGSILAFLNNDLVLDRGWLGPMLGALQGLGWRAGLVGNVQVSAFTGEIDHTGIIVTERGKPVHDRDAPSAASLVLRPYRKVAALTGACMLVGADTWRRLGGFDEGFVNGCEDIDLCLRACAAGLVNVVALRSRVRHKVSSSKGRKAHDEANTRRLLLRWRYELAVLACRRMASEYFEPFLPSPRDNQDKVESLWIAGYLLGLHTYPPPFAVEQVALMIDRELARWRTMFSD
jgi:GT2 family glycosyltransferase